MMRHRWLIYLLPLLLTSNGASAQEVFTGLTRNTQLEGMTGLTRMKAAAAEEPLSLPFFDDFSRDSLYPSVDRWSDLQVFVNNTLSVSQPSLGVATFDCLDEYGLLYDQASNIVFTADRLTSRAIDLAYPAGDSIWLSFLYEAGGVADMPESDDSLTLSFWAPDEEIWYSVWQAEGDTEPGFRQAMIPVTDSRFLKNGFRFMFTGYASLAGVLTEPSRSGTADQWNLDHVYLDRNRSRHDTVIHDVAMTLPLRSLVKEYEAMPWKHFRQAYLSLMSPAVSLRYRNNDTIVRNVTRYISVTDLSTGAVVRDFDAGASNAAPLSDILYDAPLLYTYNTAVAADTAQFLVTASLVTDDFDRKQNDTIRYLQQFSDYFAIDDGTAEAGYGINGQGANNARVALRFRSFIPDSVRGISICFNDAYDNANQRAFDIMVWADDNGQPGAVLGSAEGSVATPGGEINGFVTYLFDRPVQVTDYFWVGWSQLSDKFLNAGLDLNTPNDGRQYFMLSGVWQASQAPGTLMMRPVMRGAGSATSSDHGTLINDLFTLFPNPTSGQVTLVPSDRAPDDFTVEVISSTGARVLLLDDSSGRYDLSRLAAGTYILLVKSREGLPLSLLRVIKLQ
ncbi:MAG: T9SS type A sorting domain-containing protein [Bacteroidales bacterium]|jgi:hypothetical protein|nr:T9SS type A sorting domain-containing protein [Bacteroidales bacterium]